MKEEILIKILGILLGVFVGIIIGALIFWGLGNLFIYAFNIDYEWTFLHGFVSELIWMLLIQLFKNLKNNNK